MKDLPSKELLSSLYTYDPSSGHLLHKDWRQGVTKGFRAGAAHDRYRRICIQGIEYREHRIIWKIMTGKDPECLIDHKDRNPYNNRWDNLREADWLENAQNSAMKSTNTSGYKGVRFIKAREVWVGFVERKGKRYNTIGFATAEEANKALIPLRAKIHAAYASS